MQPMDKNLPDNIDKLFVSQLDGYAEEPAKNIWDEIDKKLSEKEKIKTRHARFKILIAAVILPCLLTPFLLVDSSLHQTHLSGKKLINQDVKNRSLIPGNAIEIFKQTKNKSDKNLEIPVNNKNILLNRISQQDFSIVVSSLQNLNNYKQENKLQPLYALHALDIFTDSLRIPNNVATNKTTSAIVTLSKNHGFSLKPFFSFDHISGRFVEQYEFDNAGKNDYSKREKPDASFTGGILGGYQLNKKVSLLSGISVSKSMVSISSTAVNALKDASGVYKFKLATSYGFAEISKSGIIPAAGDSLLISSAAMQLNYISFPLLINYNLSNKKIKLSVHSGVALNKIIGEKVDAEYHVQNNDEAETINKIEGIKRAFFTLNTGIEARYSVNRFIDVSVSPELRYGINSINKATPIKTYPVNYGVAFNLNIRL
jgi:hypothetical protein